MVCNVASSQGVETFKVLLEGWVIECNSVEDAVAVEYAERMISTGNFSGYTPAGIERVATILAAYGRLSAAAHLRQCASKSRWAEIRRETVVMKP